MRTTTERIYKGFDRDELVAKIQKFDANREGNTVSTRFDGNSIREAEVSDQYQFFDFRNFAIMVIDLLTSSTKVEYYNLKIYKGMQEISLLVNPTMIQGHLYFQNLYLLNSTDRSRSLQFNAGLMRWDNKTGFIVPVVTLSASQKAVHKGQTFLAKTEAMNEFIQRLPSLYAEQIEVVNKLANKEVSVKSIIKAFFDERRGKNDEITPTAMNRANSFLFRLSEHLTDSELHEAGYNAEEIKTLRKPIDLANSKSVDLNISLFDAFTWYTEIYKSRDSGIIRMESFRFFDIMENFEIEVIKEDEINEAVLEQ